ncbi:MAG TPA: choice-of-anchor tandem repeat GloVer-containing protein [Rhizomicrobium sp.]
MKAASIVLFAGMVGCAIVQIVAAAEAAIFTEKVLHSFSGGGTDGANPAAGVINANGILYGTTVYGSGDGLRGTVFAVNRKTGAETVVYAFCSQPQCADGFNPSGGLINVNGTLYGTTAAGGSGSEGQQFGTAFALDPNTGSEKVLYSFCTKLVNGACSDGANPAAGVIDAKGTLYGTTQEGGNGNDSENGTAFALDPKTGTETVLYDFCSQKNCTDGEQPRAALVDVNGTLYGTTASGGIYGCPGGQACGAAFSLDPNTGADSVLHSFGNGTDGRYPEASLIAANGMLYGTTYAGGVTGCGGPGCGTVFSIDPNTGAEKVLYSFCSQQNCADGANPFASLIDANGTLYGTTRAGGSADKGTVFSLDPSTGAETALYSFCSQQNCTDGANPIASLIEVKGKFYGTTDEGGAFGYGTVFVLKEKR